MDTIADTTTGVVHDMKLLAPACGGGVGVDLLVGTEATTCNACLARTCPVIKWSGTEFFVLGTGAYGHDGSSYVWLMENDGGPMVIDGIDHSFRLREVDLRDGHWTAR